ncbi:MAG: hypothetical protein WD066_10815 [Planctomycetaceae bacterium]
MLSLFALRLVCGMSLMWAGMPRREVTSGFFRIQMLVALGLSVLAALTFSPLGVPEDAARVALLPAWAGRGSCILLAGLCFLGSVMWTLERRGAGEAFVFAVAAVSTAVLLLAGIPWPSDAARFAIFHALSELATACVLGAAVTGMLLGHWYLTAPTMSIAPLGRLNQFLAASVSARLVLSAIGLVVAWPSLAGRSDWLLWVSLRWAAGIVGPLILSAMVWRILKYRHTQSATGVLFAATILVFLGELTASLLSVEVAREIGVPL